MPGKIYHFDLTDTEMACLAYYLGTAEAHFRRKDAFMLADTVRRFHNNVMLRDADNAATDTFNKLFDKALAECQSTKFVPGSTGPPSC